MNKIAISDRAVYALHKWFGLVAGLFLLMLSVTGVMLVFNEEIDTFSNKEVVLVEAGGARLPTGQLVKVLVERHPEASLGSTFLYPEAPNRAVMTELTIDKMRWWIYQNPATGAIIGERERNSTFMKKVLFLHEHLTLGDTGHAVLLLVGISLLGLVITGVWYYRKSLLSVFKIGVRNKNTFLLHSDLHKLVGVTSFVFLFVMAATGVFMHWEKVERMLGETPAATPTAQADVKTPDYAALPLENSLKAAAAALRGFVPAQIKYPKAADGNVVVAGTRPESNPLLGKFPTSIEVSAISGKVVKVEHLEDRDLEANAETAMEQIHFGHFGGLLVKLLYGLGGIGLGTMTVTGFVLWWKKRKPKKKARKAMSMA
jgi:uncharacterized iron-regulated membrane protein